MFENIRAILIIMQYCNRVICPKINFYRTKYFRYKIFTIYGSGVSRQLFNWVQILESNRTGGCIKLAEVYYSMHDIVVLLIV